MDRFQRHHRCQQTAEPAAVAQGHRDHETRLGPGSRGVAAQGDQGADHAPQTGVGPEGFELVALGLQLRRYGVPVRMDGFDAAVVERQHGHWLLAGGGDVQPGHAVAQPEGLEDAGELGGDVGVQVQDLGILGHDLHQGARRLEVLGDVGGDALGHQLVAEPDGIALLRPALVAVLVQTPREQDGTHHEHQTQQVEHTRGTAALIVDVSAVHGLRGSSGHRFLRSTRLKCRVLSG